MEPVEFPGFIELPVEVADSGAQENLFGKFRSPAGGWLLHAILLNPWLTLEVAAFRSLKFQIAKKTFLGSWSSNSPGHLTPHPTHPRSPKAEALEARLRPAESRDTPELHVTNLSNNCQLIKNIYRSVDFFWEGSNFKRACSPFVEKPGRVSAP